MSDLTKKVYQAFDPGPLSAEDTDLYVDLDEVRGSSGLVREFDRSIRLGKAATRLLAGHRGSGKSTELRLLQAELEKGDDKMFIVYCELDEDVDRNDIDFPDVLIAIIRQMAKQLREREEIKLKPGYFAQRWEGLKKVLGSEIDLSDIDLDLGLVKFSGAIKSSPNARKEIRKAMEPNTDNWLHAANDVIGQSKLELQGKGYKDLVILVDDLDKMVLRTKEGGECSSGEYLFVHRGGQLSAFMCHMVYTMPISLAYSNVQGEISSQYGIGAVTVVPMTKIKTKEGKRWESGYKKFQSLICKRIAKAGAEEKEVLQKMR